MPVSLTDILQNNLPLGYTGSRGSLGFTGSIGFTGSRGVQGTQGLQGTIGIQGFFGIQGIQGIQGVQGIQGIQGIQGSQGLAGAFAGQGIQGVQGVQGIQGTQGIQGIQGVQGIAPDSVYYQPSAITLTTGTYVSGDLDSILVYGDNDFYIFNEVSGVPGWVVEITYENVERFNRVEVALRYEHTSHVIQYELYNYNTTSWDIVGEFNGTSLVFASHIYDVISWDPYISNGQVKTRLYHASPGVENIAAYIDYAAIVLTTAGPKGVQGIQGVQGPQGIQGTQGLQGVQGTFGFQGVQGVGLDPWTRVTQNYLAESGNRIIADTSAGSFVIVLPVESVVGSYVVLTDGSDWTVNPVIISSNGASVEGITDDIAIDISGVSIEFIWDGTQWQVTATIGTAGVGVPEGGTSGQVLAKLSDEDYDTAWVSTTPGTVARYVNLSVIGDITPPKVGQARFYPVNTIIINRVFANISLPPQGGAFTFQLNKNGVNVGTVFSIAAGSYVMAPVFVNIPLSTTDYLTVDITGVGSRDLHIKMQYL